MKKLLSFLLISTLTLPFLHAQENDGLIELAKVYKQYMFINDPNESVIKNFDKFANTELAFASEFIRETILTNNKVLEIKFLKRPTDAQLKQIKIIREISTNLMSDKPADNNKLIKNLLKKEHLIYEMLDDYYDMLFISYGNKVEPYDMSGIDFQLNNYGLRDDTEKGIFFLQAMDLNRTLIWGFMNIPKPPNYEKAKEIIVKYPKFNGAAYYEFVDLNFPDFKVIIGSEGKPQSYKEYYIDQYFDVLIYNLKVFKKTGEDEEKINKILLGSLLKEERFYKYSKKEKELKELFTIYKN